MYKVLFFFIYLFFQSTFLHAQNTDYKPALIFASSNLQFVFPQLLEQFYKIYPDSRVFIHYAASGYLAQDILAGKPYDIFFAANEAYPDKIYKAKKSISPPKQYAQGLLILLVSSKTTLSQQKMKILNSVEINKITVLNHANAPYGVAAMEALENFSCSDEVLKKIQYSNDVATLIDDVVWNHNAGFISKSALHMILNDRQDKSVGWIEVDPSLYTPLMQAYVISEHGIQNDNAMKFLKFIESSAGQNIFKNNGYKNIKPE